MRIVRGGGGGRVVAFIIRAVQLCVSLIKARALDGRCMVNSISAKIQTERGLSRGQFILFANLSRHEGFISTNRTAQVNGFNKINQRSLRLGPFAYTSTSCATERFLSLSLTVRQNGTIFFFFYRSASRQILSGHDSTATIVSSVRFGVFRRFCWKLNESDISK